MSAILQRLKAHELRIAAAEHRRMRARAEFEVVLIAGDPTDALERRLVIAEEALLLLQQELEALLTEIEQQHLVY